MKMRALALPVSALLAGLAISAAPAQALTMKECSAKYKEAQTARHPQRPEMERLPQGQLRQRRSGDAGSGARGRRQAGRDDPDCEARDNRLKAGGLGSGRGR